MPVIQVNDTGAVMYYDDSGVPEDSASYTTVILIHGLIFHGASFHGMFPYASAHNLRLIALNMRDYPGSTPFSPSELDALSSSDAEEQKKAIRSQGLELGAFLKNMIIANRIPPVQQVDDKKIGGIVLLSWSMGNLWPLSIFSNADSLDDDTKSVLQLFCARGLCTVSTMRTSAELASISVSEPPYLVFGTLSPDGLPSRPSAGPASLEDRAKAFCSMASMYYPALQEPTDDIATLAARAPLHTLCNDPQYKPTFDQLTSDEQADITDYGVLGRSGRLLGGLDSRVWWDITETALCDITDTFATVNTLLLWCDMAHSLESFGVKSLADRLHMAVRDGKHPRKLEVIKVESANHTVHLQEPQRFVELLAEVL